MIRSTVIYVVSVAGPALLVAMAIDAVKSRRVRALETLAWLTAAGALLVALVYPSLLEKVGSRVGFTVPVAVMGFIGIAGLFASYILQRDRTAALESKAHESEVAAGLGNDGAALMDVDVPKAKERTHKKAAPRRGDSERA